MDPENQKEIKQFIASTVQKDFEASHQIADKICKRKLQERTEAERKVQEES